MVDHLLDDGQACSFHIVDIEDVRFPLASAFIAQHSSQPAKYDRICELLAQPLNDGVEGDAPGVVVYRRLSMTDVRSSFVGWTTTEQLLSRRRDTRYWLTFWLTESAPAYRLRASQLRFALAENCNSWQNGGRAGCKFLLSTVGNLCTEQSTASGGRPPVLGLRELSRRMSWCLYCSSCLFCLTLTPGW